MRTNPPTAVPVVATPGKAEDMGAPVVELPSSYVSPSPGQIGPEYSSPGATSEPESSSRSYASPAIHFVNISTLMIIIAALGYSYYRNYLLNQRVRHLEILVEKKAISPISQDEPISFSWKQALKSLEGGWPLFTEENRVFQPGVLIIAPESKEIGFFVSSNLIHRTIKRHNMGVIYLSKYHGEDDLGKRLLAIESGVALDDLRAGERKELVRRYAMEMSLYERGLFIFQDFNISIDNLYENIRKISENLGLGMVIIDGREVLSCDSLSDLIGKLRIVSIKTYIPVVLIDSMEDAKYDSLDEDTIDRITAFINISGSIEKGTLNLNAHKFQGNPPPDRMKIDANTGEITLM